MINRTWGRYTAPAVLAAFFLVLACTVAGVIQAQATPSAGGDDTLAFGSEPGVSFTAADYARQQAINDSYGKALQSGSLSAQSGLPASYDLRDVGGVSLIPTSVRIQSPWENCWAHAEVASIESNILKQTGGKDAASLDLSERQLSWNTFKPVNADSSIAGNAIDADQYGEGINQPLAIGAPNMQVGAQALTSWQGLASETGSQAIPYVDATGTRTNITELWSLNESQRDWSVAHATNAQNLPSPANNTIDASGVTWKSYNPAGTAAIKQALMNNGAVQVGYSVQGSYSTAEKDMYYNYLTGAQYSEYAMPNHAVTIVGWDDDFPASNFGTTQPPDNGAFLVRNSWGPFGQVKAITLGGEAIRLYTYNDQSVVIYSDTNKGLCLYKVSGAETSWAEVLTDANLVATNLVRKGSTADGSGFLAYSQANGQDYAFAYQFAQNGSISLQGYFWLSYYDHSIMFPTTYTADCPAANAGGTYTYDGLYMYDFLGSASVTDVLEGAFDASASTPVQCANIFTARSNANLTAVTAYTMTAGSTVKIDVYKLVDGATSPTQSSSGKPALTMTATLENGGYHTIELTAAVGLQEGERFSVVETIKGADGGYLPIELGKGLGYQGSEKSTYYYAKSGAGESFYSQDGGGTWTDAHTLSPGDFTGKLTYASGSAESVGNIMIRALTSTSSPTPDPEPTPDPSPSPGPGGTDTAPAAQASTASSSASSAKGTAATAKTGDPAPIALLALIIAASGGTAYAIRRKTRT